MGQVDCVLVLSGSDTVRKSIFDYSLEELSNTKITSTSKTEERLYDVLYSMYVISSEDIEQSSATTLVELLRTVPGLWAVSNEFDNNVVVSRNFYESSILYLLDGTPMQDLMTSAFQYGNFDIPLDQIDRIEIIKGSGGSIYGANSATGVISIFTKKIEDSEKLTAQTRVASPFYTDFSISGTQKVNSKLGFGVYGKVRYFEGFGEIPEVNNPTSIVPTVDGSGTTAIQNRFTEENSKRTTYTAGMRASYDVNDKTTITGNFHYNASFQNKYSHYFKEESFYSGDTAYILKTSPTRLVANVKLNHEINENHKFFLRSSINSEKYNQTFGGGFTSKNGIVDFEAQDNIKLGFQNISFGGNYRVVNLNVHDIVNTNQINYINPQSRESLTGLFVQDNVSLFNNKINVIAGIKAEKYSLLGKSFYYSPSFKLAYKPNTNLTIWSGYTISRTTPGFDNTNINLTILRAPSQSFFYSQVYPDYRNSTIEYFMDTFGMDQATAEAQTDIYLASPQGQQDVDSVVNIEASPYPGYYNVEVINGSHTTPTTFNTLEFGFKYQPMKSVSVESNLYYTTVDGAIAASPVINDYEMPSPTKPGEYADVVYYGNYLNATSFGSESIIRWFMFHNLQLEFSHSWYTYQLEYKENKDFDISTDITQEEKDELNTEIPTIPEHVFRLKARYNFLHEYFFTMDVLYSTQYQGYFVTPNYQYQNQRFESPLLIGGGQSIGVVDNRYILNLKLEKRFFNSQLTTFIYANDLLAKPFIESTNSVTFVYPKQTGRMFGLGLTYIIAQ